MKGCACLLVLLVLWNASAVTPPPYRAIGSFQVTDPAFLNYGYLSPSDEQNNNRTLIITSFSGSPFKKDSVHSVPDVGSMLGSISSIRPTLLTTEIVWPNEATAVPFGIFQQSMIGLGSGFLPPGKQTGAVNLIPMDNIPIVISEPKEDWFYHVAQWWDINNDGLLDCITARAYVPTDGAAPQGELVWFENPGPSSALNSTWVDRVITNGPDIMIEMVWLDASPAGDSQPAIIASQFFSTQLRVYWVPEGSIWANGTVSSALIDGSIGAPFDTQWVDLNNDGKKDLLVTNHEHEADQAGVFAYIVPENWQTDPWPRYTLATNITTLKKGANQASPGRAKAFHPNTEQTDSKRLIVVGGDGAEVAFMLIPNSEDPQDWTYTREDIINTGCTVGQVEVGDTNGDGWVEFFVPAFEKNTVYAYTYSPAK